MRARTPALVTPNASCASTVGLLKRTDPARGLMLYSPRVTTDVYLVDTSNGELVHEWRTAYGTGHGVYLSRGGDILRMEDDDTPGGLAANATISIPGDASLIAVYAWDGSQLWRKVVNNATHRFHHQLDPHDFDPHSGSGTLFALTAYRLDCASAAALGRLVCDKAAGLYIEAILEIDTSGRVVWEWYMSNHLCAGCDDPTKVDINSGVGHAKADWVHANSVVYDAQNDLLLLNGAYTSEVYVINHAAPSETPLMIANASRSLLYRFGSARFGEAHDVRVVPCAGAICFSLFNNGRYRAAGGAACAFDSNGALTTSECGSEVLLVTLPKSTLTSPPAASSVSVQTIFDSSTVTSLLEDGSGHFLQVCDRDGIKCLQHRRFFSLILASAQLVGPPFSKSSYVGVMVGTAGTYFEAYYDASTRTYSDVRLVYQNFGALKAAQQPAVPVPQCELPNLVGLSRTRNSGWSTSVFHAMRYADGHLSTRCTPPSAPPAVVTATPQPPAQPPLYEPPTPPTSSPPSSRSQSPGPLPTPPVHQAAPPTPFAATAPSSTPTASGVQAANTAPTGMNAATATAVIVATCFGVTSLVAAVWFLMRRGLCKQLLCAAKRHEPVTVLANPSAVQLDMKSAVAHVDGNGSTV